MGELQLEMPVDYAALHDITHLEVSNDGWVQRTPDSWFAMSWMEYGLRVRNMRRGEETSKAKEKAAVPSKDGERPHDTEADSGGYTVYRRYNEFVCLADLLSVTTRRAPSYLPPKTMTPHLTGAYMEGGPECLQDRMKGLEEFIREDVIRIGQQQGYWGAVQRMMENTDMPDDDDQKTVAVVRRFFGVDDGWEQLVKDGAVVPGAV